LSGDVWTFIFFTQGDMSDTEGPADAGMLSRRPVHKGPVVDLGIDTVRFPDGSVGELEMVRHSGAAAVLPVLSDPDGADPQVMLIRQYRYATGGWLYEVPAGRPDRPGEPWDACARRELLEETGLAAGELRYLTTIWTTPGFTDEQIRLYVATNLSRGQTSYDHDEFVELVPMPLSRALEMVRGGEITDGKTICTLLFAAGFVFGK
jgi:ADP-ribose diphosphatase